MMQEWFENLKCLELGFVFCHEEKKNRHLAAELRVNKVLDAWKQRQRMSVSQEILTTGVFLELGGVVLYFTCTLSLNKTP